MLKEKQKKGVEKRRKRCKLGALGRWDRNSTDEEGAVTGYDTFQHQQRLFMCNYIEIQLTQTKA